MQSFIIKIENKDDELINDTNIGCYLLDSTIEKSILVKMKDQIQSMDKLALLCGAEAASLCKELNFDGVVVEVSDDLPYKKQILPERDIIGSKRVLGVICNPSRHAAMLVSEAEPEFVAFRICDEVRAQELIAWYNELFLIQSAVIRGSYSGALDAFDTDFQILNAKDYKNLLLKEKV